MSGAEIVKEVITALKDFNERVDQLIVDCANEGLNINRNQAANFLLGGMFPSVENIKRKLKGE
jgi:hypothetical protein